MYNPNTPTDTYQQKNSPAQAKINYSYWKKYFLKRVKSKSTRIKEWGEALNVFLVHYLVMWLYVIIMLLSNENTESFLTLARLLIFNIDLGLYEYFFIYLTVDFHVFVGIAISWNVAMLFAGIVYGPRATKVFFKAIIVTFYIGIFLFIGALVTVYLIITVTLGPQIIFFWFSILIILMAAILIYSVVTAIPSIIIAQLFFAKKNTGPIKPYKEMIPRYLAIPALETSRIKINLEKNPALFCPYRLKERPGCSFLGYEVTDRYPLICDQPETWMRCFVYKYITTKQQKKKGGHTIG